MYTPPVVLLVLALGVCCVTLASCRGPAQGLLDDDFRRDPLGTGWVRGAPAPQTFDGAWADAGDGGRCLVVRQGFWQSPAVPVEPLAYYRVRFRSKTPDKGYWSVVFFDAAGGEVVADAYDTVFPSDDWQEGGACVRAHALAARVVVRFHPIEQPLAVRDVRVEAVSPEAVAAWADGLAADLPPVRYAPPEARWRRLAETRRRLADGGTLRIVMLGDSICNDTSNSLFEVLLRRACPKARIEVIASVRGGTGCPYYKDESRVAEYVLRLRPDLVVIAGISHAYDAEAIRSVVRQVRAASACEILITNGAVCPEERMAESFLEHSGLAEAEALERIRTWPERLSRMAAEENVELFDTRAAWNACVAPSGRPVDWFMRDPVHANGRGKQVLGRILFRYFDPRG